MTKVLGICGSRRAASYNGMALRLAAEVMPPHMALSLADWTNIPPFDPDTFSEGFPSEVLVH